MQIGGQAKLGRTCRAWFRRLRASLSTAAVVLFAAYVALALTRSAGATDGTEWHASDRVSVSSTGGQGNGHSAYGVSINADGRFVAYGSTASNLVSGDSNSVVDVFVRDRVKGTTERVSVSSSGAQPNDASQWPSISADGRFVAFLSEASNLVADDVNGSTDVFVRDRMTGTTERASDSSLGVGGSVDLASGVSISADGRYVAFGSRSSALVAGDTNATSDIFVRDRVMGTTERASVSTSGEGANGQSLWPSISADGRFIAFRSNSTNLVAGQAGGLFVRDRLTASTEHVEGTGTSAPFQTPSISGDGRLIAYASTTGIFVSDRLTGTIERISVSSSGVQANGGSATPKMSSDGRFVAYASDATNLVSGDTNDRTDIFVRDRIAGTTARASVSASGVESNGASAATTDGIALSADGSFVAYHSEATNLVAGDTNNAWDTFVAAQTVTPPPTEPHPSVPADVRPAAPIPQLVLPGGLDTRVTFNGSFHIGPPSTCKGRVIQVGDNMRAAGGLDFGIGDGKVRAMGPGIVGYVGDLTAKGWGWTVVTDLLDGSGSPTGWALQYSHLRPPGVDGRPNVAVGQRLARYEYFADQGNTGGTFPEHLHVHLLAFGKGYLAEGLDIDGWSFWPAHGVDAIQQPGIYWYEGTALDSNPEQALSGSELNGPGRPSWVSGESACAKEGSYKIGPKSNLTVVAEGALLRRDPDRDGIHSLLDGTTGDQVIGGDAAFIPSTAFSDKYLGGTTFGTVAHRGAGLVVEPAPGGGWIAISVNPGGEESQIVPCGTSFGKTIVPGGSKLYQRCLSLEISAIVGPIQQVIDASTSVEIPTGATVHFRAGTGGAPLTVENESPVGGPIVSVTVNGSERPLAPGEVRSLEKNSPPQLDALTGHSVQYSDPLTFNVTANDPDAADTLTLTASGLPTGLTFVDNGDRTGTVSGKALAAAATYPATFSVSDGHNPPVTASVDIVVTRESAVSAAADSSPLAVKVASVGGNSGAFNLVALVTEPSDGSPGDTSKATPVTFTLAPVGPGSSISCTATPSGGGVGLSMTATCPLNNVPVNVYDVTVNVGGNYYTGSGSTVLTVYDPSLGFVTGGGTIVRNGVKANFGFNVKFLKNGNAQGSVLYIEHRPGGPVKLKSNAMGPTAIVGKTAIIQGKATLNGAGNQSFRATAIDNGEPGSADQFGLQVMDAAGVAVPEMTFPSTTLSGGNIQVP